MGCTSSVEARRDMRWVEAAAVGPRARRSFSLSSADRQRLRAKAASVLRSLGPVPGRRSGASSSKYATLSVEEIMVKFENDRALREVLARLKETAAAAAKRNAAVGPRTSTPTLTPPNEPEVINAWELMAGLEDEGPTPRATHHEPPPTTPPWMLADQDVPVAFEFDPEILSSFREALAQDTSPDTASSPADKEKEEPASQKEKKDGADASACTPASAPTRDMPELAGIVRARINAFQEKIQERRTSNGARDTKVLGPPGGRRRAVVYFTSLRGVRKTFVDGCSVRNILRSYGVRLDERDVSMHAAFKSELAQLLTGPATTLPRVFVDGRYLGGAEDVQALHEAGELSRALEGCDAAPVRKLGCMQACAACGDVRFVPCETCYGSCKIFVHYEDDDDDGEFQRCPDCNENGLIGCPVCCC
uniref:Glutaredoxin domain-containing protein n=1 Tax=Aegilops tauschii subsp. strangulata TaxID=200361 RepID=A0A453D9G9_AEGTS